MKELLIAMFLIATSSAWAEWVKIGESDGVDNYMDPASINMDDNLRRVWQIYDFKQRDKNSAMSIRVRMEYDCKQERSRVLSYSSHSEPMTSGTELRRGSGRDAPWEDLPPGSAGELILKRACAK